MTVTTTKTSPKENTSSNQLKTTTAKIIPETNISFRKIEATEKLLDALLQIEEKYKHFIEKNISKFQEETTSSGFVPEKDRSINQIETSTTVPISRNDTSTAPIEIVSANDFYKGYRNHYKNYHLEKTNTTTPVARNDTSTSQNEIVDAKDYYKNYKNYYKERNIENGIIGTERKNDTLESTHKKDIFVWKMKNPCPSRTYFFGTVHVPIYKIWENRNGRGIKRPVCIGDQCMEVTFLADVIPKEINVLLENCLDVYTELPLDTSTTQTISQCFFMPNGRNLSDVLSSSMYSRVKEHISYLRDEILNLVAKDDNLQYQLLSKRMDAKTFANLMTKDMHRTGPFSFMVKTEALRNAETIGSSLELLLSALFYNSQFAYYRGGIETAEEQCEAFNSLNTMPEVMTLFELWLKQMEQVRLGKLRAESFMHDLVRNYGLGNTTSVEKLMTQSFGGASLINQSNDRNITTSLLNKTEEAALAKVSQMARQKLLLNRNLVMGKRIVDILKSRDALVESGATALDTCFVFGVGHFLGPNSVIDYVQSQGYDVMNVRTEDEIVSQSEDCYYD